MRLWCGDARLKVFKPPFKESHNEVWSRIEAISNELGRNLDIQSHIYLPRCIMKTVLSISPYRMPKFNGLNIKIQSKFNG